MKLFSRASKPAPRAPMIESLESRWLMSVSPTSSTTPSTGSGKTTMGDIVITVVISKPSPSF